MKPRCLPSHCEWDRRHHIHVIIASDAGNNAGSSRVYRRPVGLFGSLGLVLATSHHEQSNTKRVRQDRLGDSRGGRVGTSPLVAPGAGAQRGAQARKPASLRGRFTGRRLCKAGPAAKMNGVRRTADRTSEKSSLQLVPVRRPDGGRLANHTAVGFFHPPNVCSRCRTSARATSSRQGLAATWTPSGSPSGEVPTRTVAVGHPVRLYACA
jgi:hypothetical protein